MNAAEQRHVIPACATPPTGHKRAEVNEEVKKWLDACIDAATKQEVLDQEQERAMEKKMEAEESAKEAALTLGTMQATSAEQCLQKLQEDGAAALKTLQVQVQSNAARDQFCLSPCDKAMHGALLINVTGITFTSRRSTRRETTMPSITCGQYYQLDGEVMYVHYVLVSVRNGEKPALWVVGFLTAKDYDVTPSQEVCPPPLPRTLSPTPHLTQRATACVGPRRAAAIVAPRAGSPHHPTYITPTYNPHVHFPTHLHPHQGAGNAGGCTSNHPPWRVSTTG